jgi:uncharacterized membrane protein YfcA
VSSPSECRGRLEGSGTIGQAARDSAVLPSEAGERRLGPLGALAVAGAGLAAGAVNTIVGSGSLITYPVLVSLGYSPLVANVTNSVGVAPGGISGAVGYRRELRGQRGRALWLCTYAIAGGLAGGGLLLAAPKAFETVVPILIFIAAGLMAVQPRLAAALRRRREAVEEGRAAPVGRSHGGRFLLPALVFATGIYGGYFGAAQGVILLALLALLVDDSLQRLNGLKNLLTGLVNGVAAILFAVASTPAWGAAAILAVSTVVGAQIGAAYGRRIPDRLLRYVIVVGGLAVGIILEIR